MVLNIIDINIFMQILMSVPVTMEAVAKTVTTTLEATPAHATLDMLAMASMDVWVSTSIMIMC